MAKKLKSFQQESLNSQLASSALEAMAPWVAGWIETLGRAGAPPESPKALAVPAATRVKAAATGMQFVDNYLGQGTKEAGESLLERLREIGDVANVAEVEDESSGASEPAATADRAEDPDEGVAGTSVELREGSDRRYPRWVPPISERG